MADQGRQCGAPVADQSSLANRQIRVRSGTSPASSPKLQVLHYVQAVALRIPHKQRWDNRQPEISPPDHALSLSEDHNMAESYPTLSQGALVAAAFKVLLFPA